MKSFFGYAFTAAGLAWPLVVIVWARRLRPLYDERAERATLVKAVLMLFGTPVLLAVAWLLFR
jgi:hypothetical protein